MAKSTVPAGSAGAGSDFSVLVDPAQQFQSLIGFGGAFTDAAGLNIAALSDDMQDLLLAQYFSSGGIGYTIGRVPIGSCDFSTRNYSLDDTAGDFNLANFKLAPEDVKVKIPYILKAKGMSPRPLKLFASPWSAPAWMKTSQSMISNGTLIGNPGGLYYKTWAAYFVRFLQEYEKAGLSFWGVTAQNEPTTGFQVGYAFQTMGFTPETQRDFIKKDLGPALTAAGYGDLQLMILDDQRLMLPSWAAVVYADPEAAKYVAGVAVHWYWDNFAPAALLNSTHALNPGKFILATEACAGWAPWEPRGVILGSWERAEGYAKDIIDDVENWVAGWTDWNLALDFQGGPNWVKNFVDAAIIVDAQQNEFLKQPIFYALAHFSRFLPPGSKRVGVEIQGAPAAVKATSFLTPDGYTVVVLLNR